MSMPEAAVDLDNGPPSGEHDIRSSRQLGIVQSETESSGVKRAPHEHLGLRVLPLDAGHHPGSGSGIDNICHLVLFAGYRLPTWYASAATD